MDPNFKTRTKACQTNSYWIDSDTGVPGYRCSWDLDPGCRNSCRMGTFSIASMRRERETSDRVPFQSMDMEYKILLHWYKHVAG
ncbi:hypothetical protein L2E82_18838 [Cichorium intybus]|uniref:Uncharacterized protein n=1 Tax=Cichorium intybus TaxID=13427 RepID=A0ACB9FAX5_CICIN|nr:hypothetical protein L2E82_18838 [Cichorium intybus]